jgi:hypothetical protein
MQILRCYRAICVAGFALAALALRAADSSTQAPPPAATSPQTVTNKTELKKETAAEVKARKEAEKKAKAEAAAKKKAEAKARKEAEAKAKAEKAKPAQPTAKTQAEKKKPTVQPLEAPPLPISAEQEQRLQELLQKYKADQITPEQYQAQRAKILGEQPK